ncbi:hypothetical protein FGO68_gene11422 [Halteria grandinella]|uniref:Uncharacterized protein n=1 Tax=Halteria grandinella TaxID=5974 RepID=A0A8J8T055_HALGN|nr:hypothetical protein FGO68_gene11422 [Halteria grandinella]
MKEEWKRSQQVFQQGNGAKNLFRKQRVLKIKMIKKIKGQRRIRHIGRFIVVFKRRFQYYEVDFKQTISQQERRRMEELGRQEFLRNTNYYQANLSREVWTQSFKLAS